MTLLTKSKYMTGLQCPKLLWIQLHEPEKISELEMSDLHRFEEGTLIGETAKKFFPGGVDLANLDFNENIKKTDEAIKSKKIIFEAGLKVGNLFSRIDVLVPAVGGWDIVEVKGSTDVKDQHIPDVSFQKFCAEKAGLKIRKCYLMHLNKEYVRDGEIEPEKLFTKTEVTSEVSDNLKEVPDSVKEILQLLNSKDCPAMDIGVHCSDPYGCPVEICWDFLPENNVTNLYRLRKQKAFELINDGIHSIKDVPETIKLTNNQQIQKQCEMTGKPHIDKEGIKQFLQKLEYPLHYLDFETFNTGIPMFDGLKPYQQVPFQFSLHIVKKKGAKPEHHMFLADGKDDPRKQFIEKLKDALGEKGSIIVYNQSFEKRILRELVEAFPKYKKWVENTCDRVIDLLIPFRSFHYYNPEQQGSASIKSVLPAITGKSYKGMEIADGGTASISFLKAEYEEIDEKEKTRIRKALEKYCTLDTEGMIWIIEKLEKLSK